MDKMRTYIITFLLLFFFNLQAQELDVQVTINTEKLSQEYKDYLFNFANSIQNYMNGTRFLDEEWQGPKIKCNINFIFQSGSGNNKYSAQVYITSQRLIYKSFPPKYTVILKIFDQNVDFTYDRAQSLNFNPGIFEPLTGFLNYYAYLIIGMDLNTYGALSGNSLIQKALNIALMGESSGFDKGWGENSNNSRRALVENILNDNYSFFMQDFYKYHYYGLDNYTTNPNLSKQVIASMIENIYSKRNNINLNSPLLRIFFDSKYLEIAEIMNNYENSLTIQKLKSIDPSHTSKYEEINR
jgi:hypothetical protein